MKTITLLLSVAVLSLARVTSVTDDLSALLNLVTDWSPKDPSWTKNTLACNWAGVTCSSTGAVTGFDTSGRNMTGTLIGSSLPRGLITLILNGNQFSGTPVLTDLPTTLSFMSLYGNQFSGTPILESLPKSLNCDPTKAKVHQCLSGGGPQCSLSLDLTVNNFCGTTLVNILCPCLVADGTCKSGNITFARTCGKL